MLHRAGMRANLTRAIARSAAPSTTRSIGNSLPPSYEKFPPGPRPDGVADTWQADHIDSDQGFFEDDVFPPALPGETLEEYCRRVPNIWSPCSRSTDVVDVRVSTTLEFSQDINMEDHQFSERPLIKIPPLDSDWHDANEMEVNLANPEDPYLLNGTVPAEIHPEEAEAVQQIITEGAQRVGHGHWFEADNFTDFWIELTGKRPDEMPFEKTMDRLLELNPGMTHLDIERRFQPNIGKDPWFFGEDPTMTKEQIEDNKQSAAIIDEYETALNNQIAEAQVAYDKHIKELQAKGELDVLEHALADMLEKGPDGEWRVKEELTEEQKAKFMAEVDKVYLDEEKGFLSFIPEVKAVGGKAWPPPQLQEAQQRFIDGVDDKEPKKVE